MPQKTRNIKSGAPQSPELASRAASLILLQGVLQQNRSMDDGFDQAVAGLEPRDRAFVRMLVATTLRRLGQIDAALQQFLAKPPSDPILDILRLGAAQLLFLGTPPHAAVATTVELAKSKIAALAGMTNAVMRRLSENGPTILSSQDPAVFNTPIWLWQSWLKAYGEPATKATAEAHLSEPPLDLTVKDPTTAADWATRLGAVPLPTGSLRLKVTGRVQELTGFTEGAWWVQDAAAALPAKILLHALGGGAGKTVADLCAAPGGKTAQLAAAGCIVTSVDVSGPRLNLLRDNLTRLGLNADVVTADAHIWRPAQLLDAVLLDAPCSATGTIRRHPDLPYLKNPEDVAGFVLQQTRLLKAAVQMVKPGGLVLYSVCSLQPEERRGVVDAVLESTPNLTLLEIPKAAVNGESQLLTRDGELRTLPSQWSELGSLDGFYGALLQRTQ